MKQLAIIGGGVAGMSCALYASRANCQVTIFDAHGLGGLVATIDKIENYPAFASINGFDLAMQLASQVKQFNVKVVKQRVLSLEQVDGSYKITTEKDTYNYDSVVIAVGASHNKLGFEQDYVGKGVSYCATCDGNFFAGKDVAVVGNNFQAVNEALYLADICKTVYLVCSADKLNADSYLLGKLQEKTNVVVLYNTSVTGCVGKDTLTAITLYDGKSSTLNVNALFVAIGAKPNLDFIKLPQITSNLHNGYVTVDGKCETLCKGIYSAGDCTDGQLKQIVTACSDGAKAGTFASAYLSTIVNK